MRKKSQKPEGIPVAIADIFSGKAHADFQAALKDIYHPDKMNKLLKKKDRK